MVIMFILLLMFGARKLPELARGLGQAMKEFLKAKNDIHDEIMLTPERMMVILLILLVVWLLSKIAG